MTISYIFILNFRETYSLVQTRGKNINREDKERDISKTEIMMMRVEITSGWYATPTKVKDEDGGY